jgi:hypothetical protein
MLTFFAFSGLVSAQDPAPPDVQTLVCGTNIYDGAGCDVVEFDMMLTTDNGGDNITAVGQTFWITGSNLCGMGDSACTFTGSAFIPGFDIISYTDSAATSPDSHKVTYGAVDFGGGLGTGTYLLYHVCVLVDDTGTICIDTSNTPTTPWQGSLVTASAKAYAPAFITPSCCPVVPFISTPPDVNCGDDADFVGQPLSAIITATDPDAPAGICDAIESSEFQFLDAITLSPIGAPNTAPCGTASLTGGAFGSSSITQTFTWNTTLCTTLTRDATKSCSRTPMNVAPQVLILVHFASSPPAPL